jgi:hypothetical protein
MHTGSTPKSVAERDGLVEVLNVGEPGLASFRLSVDRMEPVAGGAQASPSDADPAQIGFSPDGSMVVITARGTDSTLTYQVAANDTFGTTRTIASQGLTPYGSGSTSGGTLVVTEAFPTSSPSRRTSPPGPCRASRSQPTVPSSWRMRRWTHLWRVGQRRGQAGSGRVMGGPAGDRGRGSRPAEAERDATGAALHGSLERGVAADGGIEGRGFLLVEGRSNGRLSGGRPRR